MDMQIDSYKPMLEGKLLEPLRIEGINELDEDCQIYLPRGVYVIIHIPEELNNDLNLDKSIKEAVEKIQRDEEMDSLLL